ncbi:hypothetical protein L3X38_017669 [Prunus dulcis]|uniref:Uncharacterized protein n=1 Tax=Prunus dulcis TaxID=3755 RepID=A0AAD4W8J7_PRUDU|nr:hypothetical protein L3X38_017669 [Prunus dulcis]
MPKVISPPKEIASQHLTPFGTPSKYQAPKTGEAAQPPEPIRSNMHADRWRQPESDDEEEVGQAPPAGTEPALVIHPEMDIRNEMEVLRQLFYNGQAGYSPASWQVRRASKYELLLRQDIQRKNNSKPEYYKNPIHQVEVMNALEEEVEEDVTPKWH